MTVAPHEVKIPRNDFTAVEELAAALEGQAPALARSVAEKIGPLLTVNLAQAIGRAVAVGINRRAEQRTAEVVAGAYELMVAGLDQVTDGCTTPEAQADV